MECFSMEDIREEFFKDGLIKTNAVKWSKKICIFLMTMIQWFTGFTRNKASVIAVNLKVTIGILIFVMFKIIP